MADASLTNKTKRCIFCEQIKPHSDFQIAIYRNRWGSETPRCTATCLQCVRDYGVYRAKKHEKRCIFCCETKPIAEFHSHRYITRTGKQSTRLMSGCKVCNLEALRRRRAANPEHYKAKDAEFRERNRDLRRQQGKQYYAVHRDVIALYAQRHRLKKYGLSLEEYARMAESQEGRCAACGNVPDVMTYKRNLFVDHCHETGKVRGLLCHSCNVASGLLKESPTRVRGLLEYLERAR